MCLPQKLSGETLQFIASAIGSLQFFNFGLMFGITPSNVKLYQSPTETPLNASVDANEATWLYGYLFGGVAVGSLVFGLLTNKIGPKVVLVLSGLLQLTSWFCIHFSSHIQHVQSSRAFNGAGFGAAYVVLPIFITEITKSSHIAAKYIAFAELSRAVGIFFGYVLSIYIPYGFVAIFGIAISIAFTLLFPFIQDSPHYLMGEGNASNMEKSLRWYRGIRHVDDRAKPEYQQELDEFMNQMQDSQSIVTITVPWSYKMKLGIYCFTLMMCSQLSGLYFVLNYALDLYVDTTMALIFGGVLIVGALFGIWIGVNINRKIILSLSGLVCGFSMTYLVVADKWDIVSTSAALTISMVLLSVYVFASSCGLQPVIIVVIQELLPPKLRSHYISIISAFSWLVLFAVIQSYQYVSAYNLTTYFGIFAVSSFLIVIIALAFLPNTRSKTKEEIQCEMGFAVVENIARLSTISGGRLHENTYL